MDKDTAIEIISTITNAYTHGVITWDQMTAQRNAIFALRWEGLDK